MAAYRRVYASRTSPAGRLPRSGISSGTLRSAVEYDELPFLYMLHFFLCRPVAAAGGGGGAGCQGQRRDVVQDDAANHRRA